MRFSQVLLCFRVCIWAGWFVLERLSQAFNRRAVIGVPGGREKLLVLLPLKAKGLPKALQLGAAVLLLL